MGWEPCGAESVDGGAMFQVAFASVKRAPRGEAARLLPFRWIRARLLSVVEWPERFRPVLFTQRARVRLRLTRTPAHTGG
jgi:hypothetical protein